MTAARSQFAARLAVEAAGVIFFLALAVLATRPLAADLTGATLSGPDPRIDLWTLHWVTGHVFEPGRLFGGNVFAPFPRAVLHSDLSLGSAVLVLPLRPFVSDPVPLYNLGVLLAVAFAGWSFHVLARALGAGRVGGLVCGVLAACGSHQLHHAYHLNLLSTGWLALFLLGLHRLIERPGVGAVLLAGVSFALSALSSGYYAVAAALLGLVFAAWHARRFTRRSLGAAAAAALVGALLLLPYVHGYLALRAETRLERPRGLSARMAFQPARDLGSRAYAGAALVGEGDVGGEKLFPGGLTLLLALAALVRRRPHGGFYACATAVLLVVALGPRLPVAGRDVSLPYGWLFALPPFDSMRHPYTFAGVAVFLLAVLAGLGVGTLPARGRRWSAPLLVGLALLETLGPALDVRPVRPGLPPAYEALRQRAPGVILELPVSAPDTMLWAARHGLPVANGVGAFAPPETLRLENVVRREWLRRRPVIEGSTPLRLLREVFGVRYVIVPAGGRPAYRRLAQAFERSHSFTPLETYADGTRLFELLPEPATLPGTPAPAARETRRPKSIRAPLVSGGLPPAPASRPPDPALRLRTPGRVGPHWAG